MTEPEAALAAARESAAAIRAAGGYGEESSAARPAPVAGPGLERLLRWALIEPDLEEVRSTRLLGAPVTLLKRMLLRLLAQYNMQLVADQTRFNVDVLAHLGRLEHRIEELERAAAARCGAEGE